MIEENGHRGKQRQNRISSNAYVLGMIFTLGAAGLWGSTYPAIKIDLLFYNVYEISMLRAVFASLALFAYVTLSKKQLWFLPRDRHVVALLVLASFLGATGFWTLLNLSVFFVDPDTSSFLVALYPLIAIMLASSLLKEKMTGAKATGVTLGILGTFVIVFFGRGAQMTGTNPVLGEVAAIMSAFSWAGYMIISKLLMGKRDSKTGAVLSAEYITFMTFLIAIIPTLIVSVLTSRLVSDLTKTTLAALTLTLYLGVMTSAFAFVVFNVGMKLIGVSRSAVNQLLFPCVAVIISYLFLGEIINLEEIAGIALIIVGIIIAQINAKG